ncbi:MAG TPA: hypothetical protein VK579_12210 [Terriglobales bacterium]|nr:hypothetical protein [Terriglobales bacterium]
MSFHVATLAVQPDNVELQRTFLAAADSFVERAKPVSILGINEAVNVFADHHFSAVSTHHPETGQIHVNQGPVSSDELYTFWCGLNNGAETLLAVAHRSLNLLLRSDVARNFRSAYYTACCVFDGRNCHRDVQVSAVLAQADSFKMLDPLTFPEFVKNRLFRSAVGRDYQRNMLADGFLCGMPEDSLRTLIPSGDYPVEITNDCVIRRLYDCC